LQVDISNNGIQTLPDDDEHLIVVTGAEDDGLRNLVDELAALSDELNGKEDGPRIRIIVDQKVVIPQSPINSLSRYNLSRSFAACRYDWR
jgi:nitrogen-specific signal transduction histidine kinase